MNKIIFGGVILAVIIIIVIGSSVVLDTLDEITIDNQPLNQPSNTPKKITLELSDGMNFGEGKGP